MKFSTRVALLVAAATTAVVATMAQTPVASAATGYMEDTLPIQSAAELTNMFENSIDRQLAGRVHIQWINVLGTDDQAAAQAAYPTAVVVDMESVAELRVSSQLAPLAQITIQVIKFLDGQTGIEPIVSAMDGAAYFVGATIKGFADGFRATVPDQDLAALNQVVIDGVSASEVTVPTVEKAFSLGYTQGFTS